MIGQLANIAGLQLEALKPTEVTVIGKPLPGVNSIVEVNVLGKSEGTFRLLIDGNVFQAKLPMNLTQGEFFLAKVISTNPFTLSLDNLLAVKNLNAGIITQMLSKLHIRESETSSRLLKNFVGMKKPVVKSKLERLIEALEGEDINLDEQQLNFLLQVVSQSEKSYDYLDESFAKLFEYPARDLSAVIFKSAKELITSQAPAEIKSLIDKELILHIPEDGQLNAQDIKEKANLSSGLLDSLEQYGKSSLADAHIKLEVSTLKAALLKYELLRANRERLGSYPEFLIVENQDEYSLLEYNINKARSSQAQHSFAFEINMVPDSLGDVSMRGCLSGNRLKVNITSDESVRDLIESEKGKLLEQLNNNLIVDALVDIKAQGENSIVPERREGFKNINVKV